MPPFVSARDAAKEFQKAAELMMNCSLKWLNKCDFSDDLINTMEDLHNQIKKNSEQKNNASIAGGAVSTAGVAMIAVGALFIPFTFGGGMGVVAAGAVVTTVGVATAVGALINQLVQNHQSAAGLKRGMVTFLETRRLLCVICNIIIVIHEKSTKLQGEAVRDKDVSFNGIKPIMQDINDLEKHQSLRELLVKLKLIGSKLVNSMAKVLDQIHDKSISLKKSKKDDNTALDTAVRELLKMPKTHNLTVAVLILLYFSDYIDDPSFKNNPTLYLESTTTGKFTTDVYRGTQCAKNILAALKVDTKHYGIDSVKAKNIFSLAASFEQILQIMKLTNFMLSYDASGASLETTQLNNKDTDDELLDS